MRDFMDEMQKAAENAGEGQVIRFTVKAKAGKEPELSVDVVPDLDEMTKEELEAYLREARNALAGLEEQEPKDEESEEYDLWADDHEELEDLIDEILDRLDELA